jgi:hypothetical protein
MKRSLPTQPGAASARLGDHLPGTIGSDAFARIAAVALLIASSAFPVFAQMELTGAKIQPPSGENSVFYADFFLQQTNLATSFTQAEAVVPPIKVTVNGELLPENRVQFVKTTDLPKYSCAVLLLADNTLANRPGVDQKIKEQVTALIKKSLLAFIEDATVPPFMLEIAAASNGNVSPLATMGSEKALLQKAVGSLHFDDKSPSLYLELKDAISRLSQTPANRKFLVLFSDGVSDDKANVASIVDVIDLAAKANIHICSIGFPTVTGSNVVQSLEPLAEKTGGAWVEASAQTSSGHPQSEHSKLALPNDIEGSLLNLMVSGGLVQVQLAGLSAPLDLSIGIRTQLNHLYTITHKVEYLPVPPTPTPAPSVKPAPTPKPVPPSLLEVVRSWLMSNLILVSIAAAVILAGLVALILLVIRRRAARPVIADLPDQSQSVPQQPDPLPEPEQTPLAWLESLDSDQTRYPISKTAVRIGRKPDNDIVMKNDTISAHHAEILKRGPEFIIADLGSSNQVFVGGKQVHRTSLQDGDIIELGEVRLRFLQPQAADPDHRTLKIS